MKKHLITIVGVLLVASIAIFSCKKKNNSGIAPEFGNSGNPTTGQTVTGNTTYTNPASDPSSVQVGGSGWSNPTCGTTNSLTLKAYNGVIDVTLGFSKPVTTGTYVIAGSPGDGACTLSILNAPNQPSGITWYGKSGSVVVNVSPTSISAVFPSTGVVCTQQSFNFPTVTAYGVVSCSQ